MNKIISLILIFTSLTVFGQNTDNMDNKFVISANGKEMTATFADNSSAAAFRNLIADAPLTVSMSDYGNFEKVGELGHNLPTNDTRITTEPGDVILYLGNNITIYYDVNTWTFTRLGKIDGNPTRTSILSVLGNGTVNVTFSLKSSSAGINDISSKQDGLNVAIEGLTINIIGKDGDATVAVLSLEGKTIYSGNSNQIELPSAGLYIIECNNLKAKVLVK